MTSPNLFSCTYSSPVGSLKLYACRTQLRAVLWPKERPGRVRLGQHFLEAKAAADHPLLERASRQLDDYFSGRLKTFRLPLAFEGTEFQRDVWNALLEIPFGQTLNYGQIARRIRRPKAARAVGAAVGKNPLSIVVPCHRVIGSNHTLTGFAGGLPAKAQLLRLEGAFSSMDEAFGKVRG